MSAEEASAADHEVLAALDRAHCNICGEAAGFGGPNQQLGNLTIPPSYALREGLVCRSCTSISRDRAILRVLGALLGEGGALDRWHARPDVRVLETSGYRGHPDRMTRLFDYFNTRYLPPADLPSTIDGRTTANLEDLPYPREFFDVVVTAEVLEHVAELDTALRELHRVLGSAGHMVITIPYFHSWARTPTRTFRWHDRDVFLYPPEYHAEETLVYRIFGRDLLAQLARVGFSVAYLEFSDPRWAIATTQVIIATKAPYLDLTQLIANSRP